MNPAFDVNSPHLAPSMAASLKRYWLAPGEVQVPKPYDKTNRRIVCAANKEPDGTVFVGVRHHDMLMNNFYVMLNREGGEGQVQGFVDDQGKFLNRHEAWRVAFDAGQIINRCAADDSAKLWSENLY